LFNAQVFTRVTDTYKLTAHPGLKEREGKRNKTRRIDPGVEHVEEIGLKSLGEQRGQADISTLDARPTIIDT
jgi:hypothetical protein